MFISEKNSYLGQMWMRDSNDNVYPLNEALSAVFLKYKKQKNTFYNELTSNRIKNFETFYDSFFIQTKSGYVFEKYTSQESFITPYNKIDNFNSNKTNNNIDYWFDETSGIVYFFEFVDSGFTPPLLDYSMVQYAFNFKSFDTKNNIISNHLNNKIYFWLYQPINLFMTNGYTGDPKLSYNPETKTFNVSFTIKNDLQTSLGIISMNFKKDEILEINTWIPFGDVMPLGYEPLSEQNNTPYFLCSEDKIRGDQGFDQFYVNFGSLTGVAGIKYDSFNVPDKFDIIWDGNLYTSNYVGSNYYNEQLLALGIPLSAINTGLISTGKGTLNFTKNKPYPNFALIRIAAPLGGTAWEVQPICLSEPLPTPTPTPTKTPNFTQPPATPTRTPTPTPTPTPPTAEFRSIYIAFE
jgi:hypothetical protein